MGSGKAKEIIYMIHGHELRGTLWEGKGVLGGGGQRGKWDNPNIIIKC